MMESYEKYVIKNNNNVVGNASILKSARNVVEAGGVMMVPLLPMEDVTETGVASTSFASIHHNQDKEYYEEPIVVEHLESSFEEQEEDTDSSSGSDVSSEERTKVEGSDISEEEGPSRPKNSPMIFAIPVDNLNAKGKKDKAMCMLCNKVMKKKSFSKHIDRVHTSNVSKRVKEKCNDCGKIMLKESLSMHMKSVHFKEKVKCDECGVELAVSSTVVQKSYLSPFGRRQAGPSWEAAVSQHHRTALKALLGPLLSSLELY